MSVWTEPDHFYLRAYVLYLACHRDCHQPIGRNTPSIFGQMGFHQAPLDPMWCGLYWQSLILFECENSRIDRIAPNSSLKDYQNAAADGHISFEVGKRERDREVIKEEFGKRKM